MPFRPVHDHLEIFCDPPLSEEQVTGIKEYLAALVYETCYELPQFPDSPMDWACSTLDELEKHIAGVLAKGGRVSWIGPGSYVREIHAHKAFREEIRQRLIRSMESK